jgi:hypothetical protein
LSLVVRVKAPRIEPSATKYQKFHNFKSLPRAWFSLNSRRVDSDAWLNPQRTLYPTFFKVTGKPRGRPPGSPNRKNKPKA